MPADAPNPAIAPFDAEQARKHQEAWAKYLGIPVEYSNSIGMKFRLIPPGEFTMGSTAAEIDAALKELGEDKHWQEWIKSGAPQHKVILTQPIYLGVNEVTQAEYEKVTGTNPSHFAPMGIGKEAVAGMDTANHPVEMVTWNDAAEFCAKLSQQEKLKPFYFRAGETITPLDGTGYRLPSEAEWEFACRAGTTTKYWIGDKDEDLVRVEWFSGNSGGRTHAVGELKANPFGLADMHGNVWEWVQDGWDATFYGQFQGKPATNPSSPFSAGSDRVLRGGFWQLRASVCRSSGRYGAGPPFRNFGIGFRVSLNVDAVRQAGVGVTKKPLGFQTPGFDQWVKDVQAMPAEQQVEAVVKKLQELNPEFDGKEWHDIQSNQVHRLHFLTDDVTDISPVRALIRLQELNCSGSEKVVGPLSDLSPLKDMNLRTLNASATHISDLSPLRGMKLTRVEIWATPISDLSPIGNRSLEYLNCAHTQVTNLSPLKGTNLDYLQCSYTQVSDLSPLKGMKLTQLWCHHTNVHDLSPLADTKLAYLWCGDTKVYDLSPLKALQMKTVALTPKNITQGMEVLHQMKSLDTIGIEDGSSFTVAEFWKKYDAGEFGKPAAVGDK